MVLNLSILAAVVLTALLLWRPRVAGSVQWRAMTTPLASIIGSGFLVLGPILDSAYGAYAPLVMAGLCLAAYAFGGAIRFNMQVQERDDAVPDRLVNGLETVASWSLGLAYMISVSYYLNLFGAFGVSMTTLDDPLNARLLTTAVFVILVAVGWRGGFRSLERLEYTSVTAKLAIIAGLLLGMAVFFANKASTGQLLLNPPREQGWAALALAFGLIVTVQGFETSRYLGADYDLRTRVRSMRAAQLVTTVIYLTYIVLLAYVFAPDDLHLSETAIIDMMHIVAPILPFLLVAAAMAAQFSAAIADTAGSGGLIAEQSRNWIPPRRAYVLLTIAGLILTWSANVFEIITYASRAFGLYYALQSLIATRHALLLGKRLGAAWFAALVCLGLAIVFFGHPIE